MIANKRIINELKDIQKNPSLYWKVQVVSERHWVAEITTDLSSPFHSIPFKVKIIIPEEYPFEKPPTFTILEAHKFFHPNIGVTGSICQETIKNKIDGSIRIRDRLDSIVSLMSNPNFSSCLNSKSKPYQNKPKKEYYRKAMGIYRGVDKYEEEPKKEQISIFQELIFPIHQPTLPLVQEHIELQPLMNTEEDILDVIQLGPLFETITQEIPETIAELHAVQEVD